MTLSNISSIFFYFSVFALTFLFAFLHQKHQKKAFAVISVLIPAIAIAMRFGVGTDSMAYSEMFDVVSEEPLEQAISRITAFSMEPTAIFLIRILDCFAFGHFAFYFAYSLLTFACLFFFAKKLDKNNAWIIFGALVLIMLPYCINGMRQAAAISLFALLLLRVFEKPSALLSNLALFLLAFCLHFSAIILIPVLFVAPALRRFSAKKVAIFATFALLCALFIFPKFITLLLDTGLMPGKYANTLELYGGSIINFDFVIFLSLAALLALTRKKNNSASFSLNTYSVLIILCGLFYASLGFYSAYIGRMADYFWPFVVFGFWLGIDRFKDSPALKRFVFIAALAGYFALVYFVLGNTQIIPFRLLS